MACRSRVVILIYILPNLNILHLDLHISHPNVRITHFNILSRGITIALLFSHFHHLSASVLFPDLSEPACYLFITVGPPSRLEPVVAGDLRG
jgi:hypothetical protein